MSHEKFTSREKRKMRIRVKIAGTSERPRLTVYRSNRYVYAQIIDDFTKKTLVSAHSLKEGSHSNKEIAKKVGQIIADKALEKKIEHVVFDRPIIK